MFGFRQSLLVDPVIISAHVGVNEGADEIELNFAVCIRQQLVHGPLLLPWGKAYDQCECLCTSKNLARCPLSKRSAENLGSGTLCEQLHLETVEHCISHHAKIRGCELRQM